MFDDDGDDTDLWGGAKQFSSNTGATSSKSMFADDDAASLFSGKPKQAPGASSANVSNLFGDADDVSFFFFPVPIRTHLVIHGDLNLISNLVCVLVRRCAHEGSEVRQFDFHKGRT
jgi:hypothetical protein